MNGPQSDNQMNGPHNDRINGPNCDIINGPESYNRDSINGTRRLERGKAYRETSRSPESTRMIGRELGKLLTQGDVVFIYGEIGAGKTVFVSGIAHSLGIRDYITSPTFTIANVYEGLHTFYHFDAFRIENPSQLFETGFYDYAGADCIIAVEWAERLSDFVPESSIEIRIDSVGDNESERKIEIRFNDGENAEETENKDT